MRICLIPLKTEPRNPAANLVHLKRCLGHAARYKPDLVVFPECTLTGYLCDERDIKLFAEPIPGPATGQIAQQAREHVVHICFGLLEATDQGTFNAAVLFDRTGQIVLRHRKLQESAPFVAGDTIEPVPTELGRVSVLICGDLFNAQVIEQVKGTIDLALVPMARSFEGRSPDRDRWLQDERQEYVDAVQTIGVLTVLVNALENTSSEGSFGGAMVVSGDGQVLAESVHGTDNILFWEKAG
ncbi:MAG: carbon-nitrogen hydrolase family protein [Chloroflexi bacterium]|nr:carbon-nitrogen hydrolase family protein [Chloroflexota bacterium]MBU1746744.1 carbon-nitrogen hydrolase family protein [Chloroflexota bacterium]